MVTAAAGLLASQVLTIQNGKRCLLFNTHIWYMILYDACKFGWVVNAGKFCSRLKFWSLARLFSSSSGDLFSTTMLWGGAINKDKMRFFGLILSWKDICLEEAETGLGRYQQHRHEDLVLAATFHSSSNPDRIFYPKRFRIGNSIRQGFFRKPCLIGFFIRNGFG